LDRPYWRGSPAWVWAQVSDPVLRHPFPTPLTSEGVCAIEADLLRAALTQIPKFGIVVVLVLGALGFRVCGPFHLCLGTARALV